MSSYNYSPLAHAREIRLIRFGSSFERPEGRDIQISLLSQHLDTSPSYHALSYTWGDPRSSHDSKIQAGNYPQSQTGNETLSVSCAGMPIPVTTNLLMALSNISRSPQLRLQLWWIDAVCINQADDKERSAQVSIMGSIYSKASMVVVWLGRTGDDADAYAHLETTLIGPLLDLKAQEGSGHVSKYHLDDDKLWEKLHLDKRDFPLPLWEKVNKFLSRAWFSRGWVVQEVSLARAITVLCGHRELSWDSLIGFAGIHSEARWFQEPDVKLSARGQEQWGSASWQLQTLLRMRVDALREESTHIDDNGLVVKDDLPTRFRRIIKRGRQFETGDPRDKIYAFLGLASLHRENDQRFLRPDYSKPTQVIYTEAAAYLIDQTSSLRSLTSCEGGKFRSHSSVSGLPSWVPDFTFVQVSQSLNYDHYNAAEGLEAQSTKEPFKILDNTILHVEGVFVDTIEELGGTLQYLKNSSDFAKDWEMFLRLDERYWNGQPRTEVIWRTLIADYAHKTSPVPSSFESQFRSFVLFIGSIIYDPSIPIGLASHKTQTGADINRPDINAWTNYHLLEQTDRSGLLPSLDEIVQAKHILAPHLQEWSRDPRPAQKSRSTVGDMQAYHRSIVPAITGRKLFRSAGEHNVLGLSPFFAEPGDELWILRGSQVPFVLRPRQEGSRVAGTERRYELVGEAYIHGLMHGEIVRFRGERETNLESVLLI